jgi:transcription factor E2F3
LLPGLLTKKFINLLQEAEDGTIDLNKAAEALEVWFVVEQ